MPRTTRASRSGSDQSSVSEASKEPVKAKAKAVEAVAEAVAETSEPVQMEIPDGKPKSGRFHKDKAICEELAVQEYHGEEDLRVTQGR